MAVIKSGGNNTVSQACDAGGGCSISCSGGCYALRVLDTGECHRGCAKSLPGGTRELQKLLSSGAKVSFAAKGLLPDVAVFFDKLFPNSFAIPTAKAHSKVNVKLANTSLDKIVKSLGLVNVKK